MSFDTGRRWGAIAVVALAGCGGGGEGDAGTGTETLRGSVDVTMPTRPSMAVGDLTITNYLDVGADFHDVVLLATEASATFVPARDDAVLTWPASGRLSAANRALSTRLASSGGRQRALGAGGGPAANAVRVVTDACTEGGSMETTFDDRDNSLDLSAGDTLTLRLLNCREGGVLLDGTVATAVSALSETAGAITHRYTRLRVDGWTLDGEVSVAVTFSGANYTTRIAATDLSVAQGATTLLTLGFTHSGHYDAASALLSGSVEAGVVRGRSSYWMQQLVPFTGPVSVTGPTAGSVVIFDREGDRVVVTASTSAWRYAFFRAGNTSNRPDDVTEVPKH